MDIMERESGVGFIIGNLDWHENFTAFERNNLSFLFRVTKKKKERLVN